jgi:hypothetical protein
MRTLISLAVITLFGVGVFNAVNSAEPGNKGKPSCMFHMDGMKDAKYEVTNTPDGVIIKITSDKPDVVKQIQEKTAKCQEAHKSSNHKNICPMKNDSTAMCPHHQQQEKK